MESGDGQPLDATKSSASTTAADRRRSPRREFAARGWLSAEAGAGGRNYSVTISDLSLHGIGFASNAQLEPDAIHWVVLDAGGLRASSRIRIISCRRRDAGGYDCGAEFF